MLCLDVAQLVEERGVVGVRELGVVEDGVVRSAGRVATTPETLGLFARSLGREDRVALEVTGNAWPAGHGAPDPQFEITSGWKSVRTVVDVGGGTSG